MDGKVEVEKQTQHKNALGPFVFLCKTTFSNPIVFDSRDERRTVPSPLAAFDFCPECLRDEFGANIEHAQF